MDFKSKRAYLNWLKYGHATGVFEKTPSNQEITIRGKKHEVKHKKGGKR